MFRQGDHRLSALRASLLLHFKSINGNQCSVRLTGALCHGPHSMVQGVDACYTRAPTSNTGIRLDKAASKVWSRKFRSCIERVYECGLAQTSCHKEPCHKKEL
ncbi:hypothetical protein LshimejAT787_1202530 [Lyophyllum shimeji]|uniref:Uncharacterized protein n=1 Tax=Lyophyllum shimeji TaxID=47721 RepID=A0A9P3UPI3_LYOSH|nr:hypothetical protein LshimejAT787_1202530 [Lyophyllum shimeji]